MDPNDSAVKRLWCICCCVLDDRAVPVYNNMIPDKALFSIKYNAIFLISLGKNSLRYSFEVPCQGTSNGYPQHMFSWINKKIMWVPSLIWSYACWSWSFQFPFGCTYRIYPNYCTYPYKRTVKQFHNLQITTSVRYFLSTL